MFAILELPLALHCIRDDVYVIPLFSNEYKVMPDIRRGTVETVYTNPSYGETCILVLNQDLVVGNTIQHLLLTFNQMSDHGVTTCDVPKKFDSTYPHSIMPDLMTMGRMPLYLLG